MKTGGYRSAPRWPTEAELPASRTTIAQPGTVSAKVLEALAAGPLKPKAIAEKSGAKVGSVKNALDRLVRVRKVEQVGDGTWKLP